MLILLIINCGNLNLSLDSLLLVDVLAVPIKIDRKELLGILFGRKHFLANAIVNGYVDFENIFIFAVKGLRWRKTKIKLISIL